MLRACSEVTRQLPSEETVASWHEEAFASVVPLGYYAGGVRRDDDVMRPCLKSDVAVGVPGQPQTHVHGSPPGVARAHLNALFEMIAEPISTLEVEWPNLSPSQRVRRLAGIIGVAVGRFVQIHPFINGNGRTSRVLWRALLNRFGLPPQATVLRRPPDPYAPLMDASMRGNHAPLVFTILQVLRAGPPPSATAH